MIDEDTYIQQGRDLEAAYGDAVLSFILGTLQPDTDIALVYPFKNEYPDASHVRIDDRIVCNLSSGSWKVLVMAKKLE